ncbi:ribosome-associated translation inhibitor RaiA [Patescibacteria group bacterium]|nr:MAG: ribosome-associated translation inhibitor RaiA [Patescibacteria group bacterium]
MINLQLTARHHEELDDKLQDYVGRKIGQLDRYMPKGHAIAKGKVVLEFDKSAGEGYQYICEVRLDVPGVDMFAKEGTVNLYAAVDIVEQKLKSQIIKYKDKHSSHRPRRRGNQVAESDYPPVDTQ